MALQLIYDKILEFPVFQGLAKSELADIIEKTRFDFHRYKAGSKIVKVEEKCDKLFFLLQGTVISERESDDHGYSFSEDMSAPFLFEAEALFGYSQWHMRSYKALTDVGIMTVDKDEVKRFLERYPIVRLNMVNQLATHVQKLISAVWKHQSGDLEQRLVDFLINHSLKPSGHKLIKIKMSQLAHELNDNRLNVSMVLNSLQSRGLVKLARGRFEIAAMERLVNRNILN